MSIMKFKDGINIEKGIVIGDFAYSPSGNISLVGDNINYEMLTAAYNSTKVNKNSTLNLVKLTTDVVVPNTNYCLAFNGSTNYVTANSYLPFRTPSGAISCWIKTSASNASYHGLVTIPTYYGLFVYTNKLMAYDFTASTARTCSGPAINDGAWHHCVFTWQSGVTNGSHLYQDNANDTVFTYTPSTASTFNFAIGRSLQAAQYFNGQIDDVRIFNRVLTTDEIDKLYNGLDVGSESLIHYFKFNEGTGTLANNTGASGTVAGCSGILTNSPTWTSDAPSSNPGGSGTLYNRQIFSIQDGRSVGEYGYMTLGHNQTAMDVYARNYSINIGTNSTTSGITVNSGNLYFNTLGYGLGFKEGSNARMGIATLSAGAKTVSTTAVQANSRILLTPQVSGTLAGIVRVSGITAGTSFHIASTNTGDTADILWLIINPV